MQVISMFTPPAICPSLQLHPLINIPCVELHSVGPAQLANFTKLDLTSKWLIVYWIELAEPEIGLKQINEKRKRVDEVLPSLSFLIFTYIILGASQHEGADEHHC